MQLRFYHILHHWFYCESFKFSYHINTKYQRHYIGYMPDLYFNKHLARGPTVEECAEMCNDRRGRCVAFDWAPPLETGNHYHYDGGHQENLHITKCIFHNSKVELKDFCATDNSNQIVVFTIKWIVHHLWNHHISPLVEDTSLEKWLKILVMMSKSLA